MAEPTPEQEILTHLSIYKTQVETLLLIAKMLTRDKELLDEIRIASDALEDAHARVLRKLRQPEAKSVCF